MSKPAEYATRVTTPGPEEPDSPERTAIPIDPQTGKPYFTVRKEGWGTGWEAGTKRVFDHNLPAGILVKPGTFRMEIPPTAADDLLTVVDDGASKLVRADTGEHVGFIDYETGQCTPLPGIEPWW